MNPDVRPSRACGRAPAQGPGPLPGRARGRGLARGLAAALVTLASLAGLGLSVPASAWANPKPAAKAKAKAAAGKSKGARPGVTIIRPAKVPAATLTPSIETGLQAGCLDEPRLASLAAQLALDTADAEGLRLKASLDPAGSASGCASFAAALGGPEGASTLALLDATFTGASRSALLVSRESAQAPLQTQRIDLPYPSLEHRDIRLPALELPAQSPQALAQIPSHLRWEIEQMAGRMVGALGQAERHELRLVFERDNATDLETLTALELIETATGRVIDGVIWMARQGEPGAYVSLGGIDHERLLWQSPVRYERITRGVGPSSATLKRRVAARPAKGSTKPRTVVRTYQYRGDHIGVDFAGPVGTPIVSVAAGEVVFAGTRGAYGKLVIIDHGGQHQTYYAHLSGFAPGLEAGRKVLRGEEIGYLGSSGFSTGPHLHFEVRRDGQYVDPFDTQGRLDIWGLKPGEQGRLLSQWLALDLTRRSPAPSLAGTTRAMALTAQGAP